MGKRIIIEGKMQKNKAVKIIMSVSVLFIFLSFGISTYMFYNSNGFVEEGVYWDGNRYRVYGHSEHYYNIYDTFAEFWFSEFFYYEEYSLIVSVGIGGIIASSIIKKITEKCEITVTDEEIYGKLARGKKVNIPLNQIIAVKPCGFKGISIRSICNTSNFYCIQNRDEVLKAIAYLLVNSSQISKEKPIGETEQLKNLKSLLDANIITQEEFEMKKNEIIRL